MSTVAEPTLALAGDESLKVRASAGPASIFAQRDLLALIAILVVGGYLRFHLLAAKSFWFDEGFSFGIARLNWSNFVHLLWLREGNMALYYFFLKFWLVFGKSEFFIRALSVIFGLAAIPVVHALGTRLLGAPAGLVAALLLSLNAFHVRYSQEARGYTLLVFLAALTSLLFVRCIEDPARRNLGLYTLAAILTVYSHFYGVLLIAAHGLSLLSLPRECRHGPGRGRSLRFFAYAISPIALFLWRAGTQSMNWLPRPDGRIIWHFFQCLAGNGGRTLVLLYALCWAAAAYARWRPARVAADPLYKWRYDFLLLWLVFPIAVVLAASQFKSIFLARYLVFCLPASILLAAAGISRLRSSLQPGVLVLVGALSLGGVLAYYQHDFDIRRDDWRTATQYLLANAQPGDGIFFYTAPGRMTFEY